MYAIVKTGGKQYRVEKGQTLLVERLPDDAGATVSLEPVLFRSDEVVFERDALAKVSVDAKVVEHVRGPKLRVFKFKPKRGYRKRTGHRQELTRLEVTDIAGPGSRRQAAKSEQAAKPDPAASPDAAAERDAAAKADAVAKADAAGKAAAGTQVDAAAKPDAAPRADAAAKPDAASKSDAPAKPDAAATADADSFDARGASVAEATEWITSATPNVQQTLAAAHDDPDAAATLLEAERVSHDGDGRVTVIDGLQKIVDRGVEAQTTEEDGD